MQSVKLLSIKNNILKFNNVNLFTVYVNNLIDDVIKIEDQNYKNAFQTSDGNFFITSNSEIIVVKE